MISESGLMRVLVTGGAGFIGSAVCRRLVLDHGTAVVNVDKLTYAANLRSLESRPTRSSKWTSATVQVWTRFSRSMSRMQ